MYCKCAVGFDPLLIMYSIVHNGTRAAQNNVHNGAQWGSHRWSQKGLVMCFSVCDAGGRPDAYTILCCAIQCYTILYCIIL